MPAPIYSLPAAATVALAAATAKSVLGVKAHANSGILLRKLWLGLDGVSASAVQGVVELCYATFATNAPGTNSTSITPVQGSGRVLTAGFTAAYNWTTEPTVLTSMAPIPLTPNSSTLMYDFPLGDEPECALGEGFVIRCNFPAAVNIRPTLWVSRC